MVLIAARSVRQGRSVGRQQRGPGGHLVVARELLTSPQAGKQQRGLEVHVGPGRSACDGDLQGRRK